MYDELVKRLRSQCQGYGKECEDCNADGNCRSQMENEAADAIEEITRENESLAKSVNEASEILRRRWIPVTERLIHSGWYLVACNEWGGSAVRKAIYDEATRKWLEFPRGGPKDITKFVTHWMPLPEPPKEEE